MKPLLFFCACLVGFSQPKLPTLESALTPSVQFDFTPPDSEKPSDYPKKQPQTFVDIDPLGNIRPASAYEETIVAQPSVKEKDESSFKLIDIRYTKGIKLYKKEKYDLAIAEFQEVLNYADNLYNNKIIKTWYNTHLWLFLSFWGQGAFDEAKIHLNEIEIGFEKIPKDKSGCVFHYAATTALLETNLYDEEIEKMMEKHANHFFQIADKIEEKNIIKLGLYFKIGYAYSKLRKEKADKKATDYFYKALKVAEEIPEKVSVDKIYANLGRINYRKGNYLLAKKDFQKYTGMFSFFDKDSLHASVGPLFCMFHISVEYLLSLFPMLLPYIQIIGYSFRSRIFCYIPCMLVLQYAYYKRYKIKRDIFYNRTMYPDNPIQGSMKNLIISNEMVFFESEGKVCFWNIKTKEHHKIDPKSYMSCGLGIKKTCFSTDKNFIGFLFEDNDIRIVDLKKDVFKKYQTKGITLTDMIASPLGEFVVLGEENNNSKHKNLYGITLSNKGNRKRVAGLFFKGFCPFDVYSFAFEPHGKYIALLGNKQIYFGLTSKSPYKKTVVEGYLRLFGVNMSLDAVQCIIQYMGLVTAISSIAIDNTKIEKKYIGSDGEPVTLISMISKASFSPNGRKIAISEKDKVCIYDIRDVKKPTFLCSYDHNFGEFKKLAWTGNRLLYITGKRKNESYSITTVCFVPSLPKNFVAKCFYRVYSCINKQEKKPMYLPRISGELSLFDFSNANEGVFFIKNIPPEGNLFYANIDKFSKKELKEAVFWISSRSFFFWMFGFALSAENSLYYDLY